MRAHLTKRRLWAIENALTNALAGAIESDAPDRTDYERALAWCRGEQERRSIRNGKPSVDTSARI